MELVGEILKRKRKSEMIKNCEFYGENTPNYIGKYKYKIDGIRGLILVVTACPFLIIAQ